MSSTNTEYTVDCECEKAIEKFNQASSGKELNWVSPAPIHPRTTAPLSPGRSAPDVISEMADRCKEWPEDETTLYWDIHIPQVDTLIDPLSSHSVRRPQVSTLSPPPAEIEKSCQNWYNMKNVEVESTLGGNRTVLLRGFFLKTTLEQDSTISNAELIAMYTTLDQEGSAWNETSFSE